MSNRYYLRSGSGGSEQGRDDSEQGRDWGNVFSFSSTVDDEVFLSIYIYIDSILFGFMFCFVASFAE